MTIDINADILLNVETLAFIAYRLLVVSGRDLLPGFHVTLEGVSRTRLLPVRSCGPRSQSASRTPLCRWNSLTVVGHGPRLRRADANASDSTKARSGAATLPSIPFRNRLPLNEHEL